MLRVFIKGSRKDAEDFRVWLEDVIYLWNNDFRDIAVNTIPADDNREGDWWKNHISYLDGDVFVTGTLVSPGEILNLLDRGYDHYAILNLYPEIAKVDIDAVIEYAASEQPENMT